MKPLLLGAILLVLAAPAIAAGGKKINKLADFQKLVVGKTLVSEGGTVKVRKNGKITGKLQGKKLTGNWNWQGRYFCRALIWGKEDMGSTCQQIRIDGNTVHFIRDKGKGRATSYVIR